jgi:hypothetical protein
MTETPQPHQELNKDQVPLDTDNKSLLDSEEDKNQKAKDALLEEKLFIVDGRKTIEQLYEAYDTLVAKGWTKELVYKQTIETKSGETISYDVFSYSWGGNGQPSLWILGGVHGEEPAGPNAFAESIDEIQSLKDKNISTFFVPLLNPVGYYRDWRYFNEARDREIGFNSSVTDSDHMLYSTEAGHEGELRHPEPRNEFAGEVVGKLLEKTTDFRPTLVIDHHEDLLDWEKNLKSDVDITKEEPEKTDLNSSYSYVYADPSNPVALELCEEISTALSASGSSIRMSGKTGFQHLQEEIVNGFVWNSADGSVDELLASLGATVFVLETTRKDELDANLPDRIAGHQAVIKKYASMFDRLRDQTQALLVAA